MFSSQKKIVYSVCLLLIAIMIDASVADAQRRKPRKAVTASTKMKETGTPAQVDLVAKTEPVIPAKSNIQRIGIVSPKATLVDVSGTEAAEAVQNTFYELMKSGTVDVVAIEARLPIQVTPEAQQKGIQYILYSTLSQKRTKSGGGLFGRMTSRVANTVSRNIPYGNGTGERIARDVATEALVTASSMANTIKAKDELTLEYKLVSVGDSKTLVSNSITETAKENGEDIITGIQTKLEVIR